MAQVSSDGMNGRQRPRELGRVRGRPPTTPRSRASWTRSRRRDTKARSWVPSATCPPTPTRSAPSWHRGASAWALRSCRCPWRTPSAARASVERALAVGAPAGHAGRAGADRGRRRGARPGGAPPDTGRGNGTAGWTDASWREAARTLNEVGARPPGRTGMRVVVHHHAGTFVETAGEIDRLLAMTDPDLVGLLLDTGHCVYGGGDPLEVLRRHGGRVRYVHLKDVRADPSSSGSDGSEMAMAEAWARGRLLPAGRRAGGLPGGDRGAARPEATTGWLIVEQDVVPDGRGTLTPGPLGERAAQPALPARRVRPVTAPAARRRHRLRRHRADDASADAGASGRTCSGSPPWPTSAARCSTPWATGTAWRRGTPTTGPCCPATTWTRCCS